MGWSLWLGMAECLDMFVTGGELSACMVSSLCVGQGVNKLTFIALCSLTVDAMWQAASSAFLLDSPAMYPKLESKNELPLVAFVRVFPHNNGVGR